MSSDHVLKKVITEAGYDAQDILARTNEPKCKNELRARTKEAKETGLCGVPTYRVFRRKSGQEKWIQAGDLVWGQDEVAVVEDLVVGWDDKGTPRVEGNSDGRQMARL